MKAQKKSAADLTKSYSVIKLIYSAGLPNPPKNDFKEYIRHLKISVSPKSCMSCNYSCFAMSKLSFITVNAHENCVTLVTSKKTISKFENNLET